MTQRVNESVEVQAPVQDVFTYWSNFENFSEIMQNVEEVRMTGQDTSHWKVKGPLGKSVEFDARTKEMTPNQRISWESVDGEVMNSGTVELEEVGPGRTRVEVTLDYADPPGGKAGEVAANVISNPEREMREDLENFEQMVERGDLGGPENQSPSR